MGTVATNFLPASAGLNLGSPLQEWNAYLNLINGGTAVSQIVTATAFTSTPAFVMTVSISVQTMTLTGNVTSSTFTGVVGFVLFQIKQDATGGRSFAWPTSFNGPETVAAAASSVTSQLFYFDGTNAWPLTPGTVYP